MIVCPATYVIGDRTYQCTRGAAHRMHWWRSKVRGGGVLTLTWE